MHTIFNVKLNPSMREMNEKYQENRLDAMLSLGAKVIHVTPILGTKSNDGTYVRTTYTESLSYVLEEPDTEEYKKNKEEKFKEIQAQVEYLSSRLNMY